MKHWFKQEAIQDLVKYNRILLMVTCFLGLSTLLMTIVLINKDEKWVLIPSVDVERKMTVSSNMFHESYLKEWAEYVMKELFYTSPERVEGQVANIKIISKSNVHLEKFFKEHLQFVQGSNVSCAFFPKAYKLGKEGVLVKGAFRYWFGGSDKQVVSEKIYLLSYERGIRGVLLLTGLQEREEWVN